MEGWKNGILGIKADDVLILNSDYSHLNKSKSQLSPLQPKIVVKLNKIKIITNGVEKISELFVIIQSS